MKDQYSLQFIGVAAYPPEVAPTPGSTPPPGSRPIGGTQYGSIKLPLFPPATPAPKPVPLQPPTGKFKVIK